MAYAYFTVHAGHSLLPIQNGGEPSVLFCWSFLLIAAFGAGNWSLSGLPRRRSAPGADSVAHRAAAVPADSQAAAHEAVAD